MKVWKDSEIESLSNQTEQMRLASRLRTQCQLSSGSSHTLTLLLVHSDFTL
jgi:hypothetical protein